MQEVTAAQLRMARAALRWSLADVREHTGLAPKTVRKLEQGGPDLLDRTWPITFQRLISCYKEHGVTFVDPDAHGRGVRFHPPFTEQELTSAHC